MPAIVAADRRETAELNRCAFDFSRGNDGLNLNEVRVLYVNDIELTMVFDHENAHGGWLDGDNANPNIEPSQTLNVTEASFDSCRWYRRCCAIITNLRSCTDNSGTQMMSK